MVSVDLAISPQAIGYSNSGIRSAGFDPPFPNGEKPVLDGYADATFVVDGPGTIRPLVYGIVGPHFGGLMPCLQTALRHTAKSGRTRNTVTDIVSPEKRSEMMSGIRAKNTKPEMRVRRALFSRGYRYRLHRRDLPGTPDIVLPGRKVAIFVHGCFWHSHAGCSLAKVPGTREDFWKRKFELNRHRDEEAVGALRSAGWRVLVVWECFVRSTKTQDGLATALSGWLESASRTGVFQSTPS